MTDEHIKELGDKLFDKYCNPSFSFVNQTFNDFVYDIINDQHYSYNIHASDIKKIHEYLSNNQKVKDYYNKKVQDKQNKLEIFNEKYPNLLNRFRTILFGEIYANLSTYFGRFSSRGNRRTADFQRYIYRDVIPNMNLHDRILKEHFNLDYTNDLQPMGIYHTDLGKLNPEDSEELNKAINEYVNLCSASGLQKIYDYLLELDNDDKIGQFYGEINYDPWSPMLRSGPIVVGKEKDNNNTYVLIGKYGEHHINVLNRHKDIKQKIGNNINEAFLYGKCAYVNKYQTGGQLSNTEAVEILKNDPRIEKVYLSPGKSGGQLKRLAKKQ